MYNVIVADDEKNIREGIVELIEWEKLGCKVCASMQNGAQVLKYLEEEKSNEKFSNEICQQADKYRWFLTDPYCHPASSWYSAGPGNDFH